MRPNFKIKSIRINFSKWFMCMYLLMFFMLIVLYRPAFSQSCDPEIKPIKNKKLKYRKRDRNRCEGFYRSLVSVEVIDVVGVTRGDFHFETKQDEVLEVSSGVVKGRPIYIRSVGVPLKLYYRMDAYLDAGETLTWPMEEVVFLRKLSSKDICVFGWVGDEIEKVYVPVTTASKLAPVKNDGKIRLVLRTSVDVNSVKWRAAGTCSGLGQTSWQDAPKSSYRAGKPIIIILQTTGVKKLCIEVAARNQKTAQWLKKKNIRVIVREK